MNRFGAPMIDEAAEAMLMIEPVPRSSIPGIAACIVRNIEAQFRSKAKAHSSSLASRIAP